MNKLITLLALTIATLSFSVANAGFNLGVAGSLANIDAKGIESDKDGAADGSMRTATAGNSVMVGSIFAEYSFDNGITVGFDHIPGTADVNRQDLTRTEDSSEANQDGNVTANAEIENHNTYYLELPIHAGLYVKAGITSMDVISNDTDSVTLRGAYANTQVDGELLGVGYKGTFGSNGFYKLEGTMRSYDTINLTSTTTDLGNQLSADIDANLMTLAVGYAF